MGGSKFNLDDIKPHVISNGPTVKIETEKPPPLYKSEDHLDQQLSFFIEKSKKHAIFLFYESYCIIAFSGIHLFYQLYLLVTIEKQIKIVGNSVQLDVSQPLYISSVGLGVLTNLLLFVIGMYTKHVMTKMRLHLSTLELKIM